MTAPSARRCKIGIILPVYEGMLGDRTARWTDIRSLAQRLVIVVDVSLWRCQSAPDSIAESR
jgi:hypothetical protein